MARIDPVELRRALALASRISGRVRAALFVAGAVSRARAGFDATTLRGWRRAGIDTTRPIWLSIADLDTGAAGAFLSGHPGATRPFWRTRAVVPIGDRSRARAALATLAQLAPGLSAVSSDHAPALAAALGAARGSGAEVVRALAAAGVTVAGKLAGGLVFARLRRRLLVIDWLVPFGGPVSWDRDRSALFAAATRVPAGRGFGARLGGGAAALLAHPGLALWIAPARLYAVMRAHQRLADARARAAITGIHPLRAGPDPAVCAEFARLSRASGFSDVAVAAAIAGGEVTVRARWGIPAGSPLSRALATATGGLIAPAGTPDAIAAGAIRLRSLEPLRALPRPPILRGPRWKLHRALAVCGPAAETAMIGVGWPELAGMFLDEVVSIDPTAAHIVGAIGPAGFAIERVTPQPAGLVGAVEVELSADAAAAVKRILEVVFGHPARVAAPRPHLAWGRGPVKPFALPAAGGRQYFGAAVGARGIAWYLAHRAAAAPTSRRAAPLASVRVDLPALLRQLRRAHPRRHIRSLFHLATARDVAGAAAGFGRLFGALRARVAVTGAGLDATLVLSPRTSP